MTIPPVSQSLVGVDCIGYVRVSSERQAGEMLTSLADQRAAIEALAAKFGRTVGAWFADEGASGATVAGRPQFRALLEACAAAPRSPGSPGLVLVLNDSRFGRFPDPEEATGLRWHLKQHGWRVRFAEGDESEHTTARAFVRLATQAQATEYRENLRRNVKRGAKGTAEQGFWISQAPYGYRRKVVYPPGRERVLDPGVPKTADEKIILTPHDPDAGIVRALFERYRSGRHSLNSLVEWLHSEGIPTGRPTSKGWSAAALRFMLTNPAYMGDVVAGRVPADLAERRALPGGRRPETEWYIKRDAHPAIVSRSLFDAVAVRLKGQRKKTRAVRSDYVLSGLITCQCGAHLVGGGSGMGGRTNGKRGGGRHYQCARRQAPGEHRCLFGGSISRRYLEGAVVAAVANVVSAPRARRRLAEAMDAALVALETAGPFDGRAVLDTEIRELDARRVRMVEALEAGALTHVEAAPRLKELRAEIGRLAERRDALQRTPTSSARLGEERARLVAMITDFPALVYRLSGPALREAIRPWLRVATFDWQTRELRLEIRHIPASLTGSIMVDLERTANHPTQDAHKERVTVRRIVVGRARR